MYREPCRLLRGKKGVQEAVLQGLWVNPHANADRCAPSEALESRMLCVKLPRPDCSIGSQDVPVLNVVTGAEADDQVRTVATIQVTSEKEPSVPVHFGLRCVAKKQQAPSDNILYVNDELLNMCRADM